MVTDAYIIDTSVLVRWFLGQIGYLAARQVRDDFLAGRARLHTVECARFELPWVLRRIGLARGDLTRDEYLAAVRVIDDWAIEIEPLDADGLAQCAALSADHNITFFDSVFVHRSIVLDVPLITADKRLANAAGQLADIRVLDGI